MQNKFRWVEYDIHFLYQNGIYCICKYHYLYVILIVYKNFLFSPFCEYMMNEE